ncbi:unnamed protein product [Allacma fusca]|uniref:Uncharacterized protein n=1 Tax=Allacma fusca TaxID=39272 RepID=A0A8J2KM15_9HEXA|nr:unnamed protein product [Allacma fusca]
MAPKCPVVAVTSTETDQTESIVIRLLFEAAGPLIVILVIRILRYLTHKVTPDSCLERLMAIMDFSPTGFLLHDFSPRFMNTLATMQQQNPFCGIPPRVVPPQQIHAGVMANLPASNECLTEVCVYS